MKWLARLLNGGPPAVSLDIKGAGNAPPRISTIMDAIMGRLSSWWCGNGARRPDNFLKGKPARENPQIRHEQQRSRPEQIWFRREQANLNLIYRGCWNRWRNEFPKKQDEILSSGLVFSGGCVCIQRWNNKFFIACATNRAVSLLLIVY
jgi:hypothetical protein